MDTSFRFIDRYPTSLRDLYGKSDYHEQIGRAHV